MEVIQLNNILPKHIPAEKVKELEIATQRIIDTGLAEMVILYGSYARGNFKLQRGKEKGKRSDFDLLVIASDYHNKQQVQMLLSGAFRDIDTHVQAIFETILTVNSNLEQRQFFFSDIKKEGIVLYTSGKHTLAEPKPLTPELRLKLAEEDYAEWMGMAKSVFEQYRLGITYATHPRYLMLGSFNLQQTVEMCYTTIEMVFTHYNPHEHDLLILRERLQTFDRRVNDVFPCTNEAEKESFEYLNFAYIGGRYRSEKEFPVTKEQLNYWAAETQKLIDLTILICEEKIESLKD